MALVVVVPEISSNALASRLAKIMSEEGLKADLRILTELAERSACDVRACLGILQYTGGGSDMLKNLNLGLKDMKKDMFDSWRDMLQVPMIKRKLISVVERVKKIVKLAHQGKP